MKKQNNRSSLIFTALLILLTGGILLSQGSATSAASTLESLLAEKVDPWVMETAAENGETEFLVFLTDQADLSAAAGLTTKIEKGTFVYETLSATAARTQGPVILQLDALGVEYRPYWVANMIWVRGDLDAVEKLVVREDVAHLYANPSVALDAPTQDPLPPSSPDAIEWNISYVKADDVWAMGINGQGAVIGGHDTGYDWDHPGLINQYRGWDGGAADHNYSWHDAIHSGGGSCGADSPEPCDDYGHGTHTMGTMVGDDGGANQVGMAPGARWIGCRNMNVGNGTPTTYSECYQWFIAPTDLNDQNPNPAMAPDAINNSWSCPVSEGCTDPNVMLTVVNNVRAAGILTAHSAGNEGSACSTVANPAAIYDASYTVGATSFQSDAIASYSSRGPVTVDASGRMKPDISAPGSSVRSTTPGGNYGTSSGTSMAAPHVAGLAGLMVSAEPALAGQVDLLEYLISQSAVHLTTTQGCGGDGPTDVPNNVFGWGRIDALAAVQSISKLDLSKSGPVEVASGSEITYTLSLTHTQGITLTHGIVLTDVIPMGTAFVTATLPHTFDGTIVTWEKDSLAVDENWMVDLTVDVIATSGVVTNDDYQGGSDQVSPVMGVPVMTNILPADLWWSYLPTMNR